MFACVCLLLLLGELMTLLGLTVWQLILWDRGSYKLAEHDGASFIYRGQHDIATFAGKTRDHVVSQEKWWTNAVLQHNTQEPSADSFRHPENDPDRQHIQSQWEGRGSQLRKAKNLLSLSHMMIAWQIKDLRFLFQATHTDDCTKGEKKYIWFICIHR